MKIVKRLIYETVMVCEHCGHTMSKPDANERYNFNFKCCVCNKEGCDNCGTWFRQDEIKYSYHEKCEKKLTKNVLNKKEAEERIRDNLAYYHNCEYGADHIC